MTACLFAYVFGYCFLSVFQIDLVSAGFPFSCFLISFNLAIVFQSNGFFNNIYSDAFLHESLPCTIKTCTKIFLKNLKRPFMDIKAPKTRQIVWGKIEVNLIDP